MFVRVVNPATPVRVWSDRPVWTDVRVCFAGDSFVAGVGDPEHLGWVGRLAAHSHTHGQPLTAYNLGVRRETSADVLGRLRNECAARLPADSQAGVVLSVGVNDTMLLGGRPRVASQYSAANLDMMLRQTRDAGWATLVVGPPAVDDEHQNDRIAELDVHFAALCGRRGVPYVGVLPELRRHGTWRREVHDGDGSHPGSEGYRALAELLLPAWSAWLARFGGSRWATPWA
jgi:lysophospholipase L1-like esterase